MCSIAEHTFYSVVHTVKNNRDSTDPVMGNCDKKSTGNREFTGKCPYILYINGQFRLFCGFSVNSRAVDHFYGIYDI